MPRVGRQRQPVKDVTLSRKKYHFNLLYENSLAKFNKLSEVFMSMELSKVLYKGGEVAIAPCARFVA